jgi:hypothetical protein
MAIAFRLRWYYNIHTVGRVALIAIRRELSRSADVVERAALIAVRLM